MSDTLSSEWQAFALDLPPGLSADEVRAVKRGFYAGAGAVLTLARRGVSLDTQRREVAFYGQQVGREQRT
jgi:hypothetical protein